MCEFHDCNCNGLGDIWWTDKCMYFSSIDYPNIIILMLVMFYNIMKQYSAMSNDAVGMALYKKN